MKAQTNKNTSRPQESKDLQESHAAAAVAVPAHQKDLEEGITAYLGKLNEFYVQFVNARSSRQEAKVTTRLNQWIINTAQECKAAAPYRFSGYLRAITDKVLRSRENDHKIEFFRSITGKLCGCYDRLAISEVESVSGVSGVSAADGLGRLISVYSRVVSPSTAQAWSKQKWSMDAESRADMILEGIQNKYTDVLSQPANYDALTEVLSLGVDNALKESPEVLVPNFSSLYSGEVEQESALTAEERWLSYYNALLDNVVELLLSNKQYFAKNLSDALISSLKAVGKKLDKNATKDQVYSVLVELYQKECNVSVDIMKGFKEKASEMFLGLLKSETNISAGFLTRFTHNASFVLNDLSDMMLWRHELCGRYAGTVSMGLSSVQQALSSADIINVQLFHHIVLAFARAPWAAFEEQVSEASDSHRVIVTKAGEVCLDAQKNAPSQVNSSDEKVKALASSCSILGVSAAEARKVNRKINFLERMLSSLNRLQSVQVFFMSILSGFVALFGGRFCDVDLERAREIVSERKQLAKKVVTGLKSDFKKSRVDFSSKNLEYAREKLVGGNSAYCEFRFFTKENKCTGSVKHINKKFDSLVSSPAA